MKAAKENDYRCTVFLFALLFDFLSKKQNHLIDFRNVPLCIEGNNEKSIIILNGLAHSISKYVYKVNSDKRKHLHLAAVFANNFSNHLFTIAENILRENKLPFELLIPIIQITVEKIKDNKPSKIQTGPAVRNDKITIQAHLKLLKKEPHLAEIYEMISKNIQLQQKKLKRK